MAILIVAHQTKRAESAHIDRSVEWSVIIDGYLAHNGERTVRYSLLYFEYKKKTKSTQIQSAKLITQLEFVGTILKSISWFLFIIMCMFHGMCLCFVINFENSIQPFHYIYTHNEAINTPVFACLMQLGYVFGTNPGKCTENSCHTCTAHIKRSAFHMCQREIIAVEWLGGEPLMQYSVGWHNWWFLLNFAKRRGI